MSFIKLFWVVTPDHINDWFIVSETAWQAAKFHEEKEKYMNGHASADYVEDIPINVWSKITTSSAILVEPTWPSRELLEALGAKIIDDTPRYRKVYLKNTLFTEGKQLLKGED